MSIARFRTECQSFNSILSFWVPTYLSSKDKHTCTQMPPCLTAQMIRINENRCDCASPTSLWYIVRNCVLRFWIEVTPVANVKGALIKRGLCVIEDHIWMLVVLQICNQVEYLLQMSVLRWNHILRQHWKQQQGDQRDQAHRSSVKRRSDFDMTSFPL